MGARQCPNCSEINNDHDQASIGEGVDVRLWHNRCAASRMTEEEKEAFYYNQCEIKWKELIAGHYFHFRREVLKEPDESIPRAIEWRCKSAFTLYFQFSFGRSENRKNFQPFNSSLSKNSV